jgi:tetratricopeptide (TPR) repeat protein
MPPLDEDEANASLKNFLSTCVTTLLRQEDPEKFLEWMRENGPALFPDIFGQIIDPAMRPSAAYSFGRIIWNATPLPGNLFKPRPLPKPERNAPCPCGTGMKFKHCCGQTDVPALPLEPALMLNLVLRSLTQKELAKLPYRSISHDGLALTAQQWLEEGKATWAIKLLEPIFVDPSRLAEQDEFAFDVLMDAYLDEGKPRKRINLIETMLQSGNRSLRVTAMQRHCTMLADAGDYARAWELFGVAMREYPGHAAFSHLEVTLLMSQGRTTEARERAKFWVASLRRQNNPDHAELIGFLASIADNHGLRERLAREYLRAGQYEKTLALCERYPGDMMADIAFGQVLALFKLDRKGEALTTLIEANEHLPEIVPMLLKDNPRQPKSEKYGISVGGKEQAWHYRQDALALWQGDALDWLRAAAPSLRKKTSRR